MERGVQTGAHIGQEERRTCMAAIEVRHLYKRFEQKGVTVEALSDINLTVEQGDIYGIIRYVGSWKKYTGTMLKFLRETDRRSGADRGSGIRSIDREGIKRAAQRYCDDFSEF